MPHFIHKKFKAIENPCYKGRMVYIGNNSNLHWFVLLNSITVEIHKYVMNIVHKYKTKHKAKYVYKFHKS